MPDMTGMAINALTGTNDSMSLLSNAVTRTQGTRNTANGAGEDFGNVIDTTAMSIMASAALAPQMQQTVPTVLTTGVRDYSSVEVTVRTMQTRPNDYSQPTQMSETSDRIESGVQEDGGFSDGLRAAVDTAAGQMQDEAASRFEVSASEVENAMNIAELNPADLLTTEGLTDFVVTLTGEDETALLTDGELYEDLQALIDTADVLKDDIAERFDMTLSSLDETLEAYTGKDEAPDTDTLLADGLDIPEEAVSEDGGVITFRQRMPREEEQNVRESREDGAVVNPQETEGMEGRVTNASSGGNTAASDNGESRRGTQRSEDGQVLASVNPSENVFNDVPDVFGAEMTYASAQPEQTSALDVMRQVLDYMRSEVREGITELEMQLNPQSLGRVHVSLSATDGGDMVARFAAQNDAVRDALASQMPQLLQRFEEQGIRVSEVQVTVEQRAFDAEQDRNRSREEQQSEHEKAIGRMGRLRRVQIDLANMDEEAIAALDEDEKIEAEMMAAEGNTVNYRA